MALPKHDKPTNLHTTGSNSGTKKVTVDWTAAVSAAPSGTLYEFTEHTDGSGAWDNQNNKPYSLSNVPFSEVSLRIRTKADATHLASDWSAPIKFTLPHPMVIDIPGGDTQSATKDSTFTVPTATATGGSAPAKVTVTPNPSTISTANQGHAVNVVYTAHDAGTGLVAADVTKTLTVNITAPAKVYHVQLKGQGNQTFEAVRGTFGNEVDEVGNPITTGVYKEQNAEVVDASNAVDSTLSGKIKETWQPAFNPNLPGNYVATYTLSAQDNPNGGAISATRTVTIKDTTKPIISLIGAAQANVAKGFDINTIYPATTATLKVDDNAAGTPAITKVDTKAANVTTRTFTVTDATGNLSTVAMTITELPDLIVQIGDIVRDTSMTTAIVPSPVTSNAQGTVTYSYSPAISSIQIGTVKDTNVTVTATEVLPHGTRTGTATFKVQVKGHHVDTSNSDFLDGKHVFNSNYGEHEGNGIDANTDSEIITTGTEYEKAVKLAIDPTKQPSNKDSVWYDEKAMDPYERRIVADEANKKY